jgi:hypothetical protein
MAVVGRRLGSPRFPAALAESNAVRGRGHLGGLRGHLLVKHSVQDAEGGVVEFVDAAGDGAEHVAFGPLGAADGLLMVGVGVDGLDDTEGGARPWCDAGVVVPQAGKGVALVLGTPDGVLAGRAGRQRMLRRPGAPSYEVILDELAIRRLGAPPDIVKKQLYHLATTSSGRSAITLRVLPVDARLDNFTVPRCTFSIYNYPDPGDPAVVASTPSPPTSSSPIPPRSPPTTNSTPGSATPPSPPPTAST